MILTEAQSTWTMNIIIRALMYLVQSYHEYFERRNDNLYGSKKVKVPKPELYVIFTGKRVSKPEYISLSEEFFNGEGCAIDVKVMGRIMILSANMSPLQRYMTSR